MKKKVYCVQVKRETIENLRELCKTFGEAALYEVFEDICKECDPNYIPDTSTMYPFEEIMNGIKETENL